VPTYFGVSGFSNFGYNPNVAGSGTAGSFGDYRLDMSQVTGPIDHFNVTASVVSVQAGTPFDVTVTAQDASNNTVVGYTGTITFSTLDPSGGSFSPATYTFSAADQGVHTFPSGATLFTVAGSPYDVTATEGGGITGSAFVAVTPAPAASFFIAVPASVSSGAPFSITVYALDPYGNIDTNYVTDPSGVVTFYTTTDPDPGVVMPANYQFVPADAGQQTFSGVVYITPGNQDINALDTFSGISGSNTVNVTAGPLTPGSGPHGRSRPVSRSEAAAPLLSPSVRPVPVSATSPVNDPGSLQQARVDRVFASPDKPDACLALVRTRRQALGRFDPYVPELFRDEDPLLS
jgi:hypothetical protein